MLTCWHLLWSNFQGCHLWFNGSQTNSFPEKPSHVFTSKIFGACDNWSNRRDAIIAIQKLEYRRRISKKQANTLIFIIYLHIFKCIDCSSRSSFQFKIDILLYCIKLMSWGQTIWRWRLDVRFSDQILGVSFQYQTQHCAEDLSCL